MSNTVLSLSDLEHPQHRHRPRLDAKAPAPAIFIFLALLAAGVLFTLYGLSTDISDAGGAPLAISAFVLLAIALLIALGFEFVNGFHDTANAVATVIYTHAMPAQIAVLWSGAFNLLGVLTSSGAVAFAVVSLLPVELILQVGSSAGFDMIFALLIAAIIWNLGTWVLGLPASSSHTLIGSIIGVGIANQLMAPAGDATSGVDWAQVTGVFKALLFSPLVGFVGSALMLLAMKLLIREKELYEPPDTSHPPPPWIRGLLVLTCTGVSFAHGSNDGQKGMGLIMLILIGAAPTAYALNRTMPVDSTPAFIQSMHQAHDVFAKRTVSVFLPPDVARERLTDAIRTRNFNDPAVFGSLATLADQIGAEVSTYGALRKVPAAAVQNIRNDMYLASEAVRLMPKGDFSADEQKILTTFKASLDAGTRVHSVLGKGCGGDRAWSGHHGRLEANRRDGGREDRQGPSDLWPGSLGRVGRGGHDHGRRHVWAAGLHHTCSVERHCRHDGGERIGPAMEHDQKHRLGMGSHAACGDAPFRHAIFCVSFDGLKRRGDTDAVAAAIRAAIGRCRGAQAGTRRETVAPLGSNKVSARQRASMAADPHKHAWRPPACMRAPDSRIPISRPAAFAA